VQYPHASSARAERCAAAQDQDPSQAAARAAAERRRAWRKRAGSPELFSDTASSRLPASSHASLYPAGHTKKGFRLRRPRLHFQTPEGKPSATPSQDALMPAHGSMAVPSQGRRLSSSAAPRHPSRPSAFGTGLECIPDRAGHAFDHKRWLGSTRGAARRRHQATARRRSRFPAGGACRARPGRPAPEMMVMGWIFCSTSFSASRSSSPASTTTEVVPSPTSASCTLLMSARRRRAPRHVLAAGPLTWYPSCPSAMSVQHHAVTPMHLSMTLSCCLASIRPLQACGQALSHRPVLWHCLPPSATARASATAGSTARGFDSSSQALCTSRLRWAQSKA